MFLKTLENHINMIEEVGLVESKVELDALLIKLLHIWIHCPYFQKYDYVVILIKVICNMIMAEVNTF